MTETLAAWQRLKSAWREYCDAKRRAKAFAKFIHHKSEAEMHRDKAFLYHSEWEKLSHERDA